jgi:hypothetical protein
VTTPHSEWIKTFTALVALVALQAAVFAALQVRVVFAALQAIAFTAWIRFKFSLGTVGLGRLVIVADDLQDVPAHWAAEPRYSNVTDLDLKI